MKLSGEEYLRVSQLRTDDRFAVGMISTAPARRTSPLTGEGITVTEGELRDVVLSVDKEPEMREQIVASLRERIESGDYQVTGEQIAEMMVRRFLADRVR